MNCDGYIDIVDALMVAQNYVGIPVILNCCPFTLDFECDDVNCDGKVDIVDALMIALYYVGILDELN